MTIEEFVKAEVERWIAYACSCPKTPWFGVGCPPSGPHAGLEGRWVPEYTQQLGGQVFVPEFVERLARVQAISSGCTQ